MSSCAMGVPWTNFPAPWQEEIPALAPLTFVLEAQSQ